MAQSPAQTCKSQCWLHKPAVHRWSEGQWRLVEPDCSLAGQPSRQLPVQWETLCQGNNQERATEKALWCSAWPPHGFAWTWTSMYLYSHAHAAQIHCTHMHTHRVVALDDRLCDTMNGLINTAKPSMKYIHIQRQKDIWEILLVKNIKYMYGAIAF